MFCGFTKKHKMSETTIGLTGEYYAAGIVLSLGWRVSMCQQDRVDLLAWKDDEFIRIQVKTASLLLQKGKRLPSYHFQFGHGRKNKIIGSVRDYDILCCVGYQHRKAVFLPISEVQQKSKRMSPQLFDEDKTEFYSFNKSLAAIRRHRNG